MHEDCEACGGEARWHPAVHLVTPEWSRCVDEELVDLLVACSRLRIPVVAGCQDELHSGRVSLRFPSTDAALRFLDEVVRAAPPRMRERIVEASCPPRIDAAEWSVDTELRATFSPPHRVLAVHVRIEFPREDLDDVVVALDPLITAPAPAPAAAAPMGAAVGDTAPTEDDVEAERYLAGLVTRVLDDADEAAFDLIDLDRLDDDRLQRLTGEQWHADSPGFADGIRVERPPYTTWLALRATVAAIDVLDVDRDEATLDEHLEEAALGARWCARAYALLSLEPLVEVEAVAEWQPLLELRRPEDKRPGYAVRRTQESLDTVTASPLELDRREVVDLLVTAYLDLLDHETELGLMAARGEFPYGDPRRRPDPLRDPVVPRPPDGISVFDQHTTAHLDDDDSDGVVTLRTLDGGREVPLGNLRHLMEAAREACGLPSGVVYACAVTHHLSGRIDKISFVRCGEQWSDVPVEQLRVGDRLFEEIDYPYVVTQVIAGDDGDVALERAGRGWVNVPRGTRLRAQRLGD